ncbi:hypothetical protein AVEN_118248-1 [Araneus ventricosus]|uniref:Uncharacterized protein n=1 Tax=Araneus ventricosus TaxID=182803 RepID=A0A4Y2PKR9_ARAVE|nr:hypothetical protein AVEN_36180-1 [Araneus ventricosus]GBN50787.1 hypothetical protein AVEN_118248-1 [Araneus ventricosus]
MGTYLDYQDFSLEILQKFLLCALAVSLVKQKDDAMRKFTGTFRFDCLLTRSTMVQKFDEGDPFRSKNESITLTALVWRYLKFFGEESRL